jgi:hypothetical protein
MLFSPACGWEILAKKCLDTKIERRILCVQREPLLRRFPGAELTFKMATQIQEEVSGIKHLKRL